MVAACGDATAPRLGSVDPVLFSIPDPINYDLIGGGTLAYVRLSLDLRTNGIVVVDSDAHKRNGYIIQRAVFDPVISPDGNYLAFVSVGSYETGFDLYLMSRLTNTSHRVSADTEYEHGPAFQNDNQLVYYARASDGQTRVIRNARDVTDAQGTELLQFSSWTYDLTGPLTARSDGTFAFISSKTVIYTYTPQAGAQARELYRSARERSVYALSFSPDGSRIAFLETVYDGQSFKGYSVKTVRIADGLVTTVAMVPEFFDSYYSTEFSVAWCGHATKIAFAVNEGDVWIVPATGGTPQKLIEATPATAAERVSCSR
jgi:WD40 repeat protein